MPQAKCKICKKEFYVKPSHLKRGWGKYCSRKCQNEGQKKGNFFSCAICQKKIWRVPKDIKSSKSQKFFCNRSCQTIWRNKIYSGTNHSLWNGGLSIYRKEFLKTKVKPICKKCGHNDKRVLIIHHKDSNRRNN